MGFIVPAAMAAASTVGGWLSGAAASVGLGGTAVAADSLGGAAAQATSAATWLKTGAAALEGVSSLGSGLYQAKVARSNAALAAQQRQDALVAGAREQTRVRMRAGEVIGAQKATVAANGIDVNSETPLALAATARSNSEYDAAIIGANAATQAYGYSIEEMNAKAQAKQARLRGYEGLISGGLDAATSLISGASALKNQQLGLGSGRRLRGNDAGITIPRGQT